MTCNWSDLEFTVYDINATWYSVAGLYIFAKRTTPPGYWRALYIGQTDDFSSRIPYHERWAEAVRLGATHVHALVVPLAANRDSWEQALIQRFDPPLNDHHR
jgi:hypothetical protein